MKMWIASLAILLFALPVVGADYYVSTEGNDDTGNGSIDNPWRTPAYGASQLTSAGDTLYIRAGTYNVTGATWNTSTIYPRANGTSAARITIRNYPDETVTLDGGSAPTNGIIGIGGYDYITIKGLIIKGQVKLMYGDHAILEDCDVSVGGDSYTGDTGFGDVIFLAETTGSIIRNCRIHDNTVQRGDRLNSPLIMEYSTTDLTIEYCDIYNSVGCGIRLKDAPNNVTIRNCHIYNNYLSGIAGPNQNQGRDMHIYQNVIRENNTNPNDDHYPEHGGIRINVYIDRSYIYNNTFHNNGFSDLTVINTAGVDNIHFFNNISNLPRSRHIALQYSVTTSVLDYSDYNCFYNDLNYELTNSVLTSLASWQSSASRDANSVITDPVFLNASGNWNLPADFKRSSYTANGRGGEYASVMGAYITGDEIIGYTEDGEIPDDTTPNQFTFTDVTDADLSTVYTSNQITISGIDAAADVSITGGTYSKNGGEYTSGAGTCANGDTFTVRVTSSGSYSTAVNVVLTIGGVSDTYTVTTGAEEEEPPVSGARSTASGTAGWR